jgi:hypothetical protein
VTTGAPSTRGEEVPPAGARIRGEERRIAGGGGTTECCCLVPNSPQISRQMHGVLNVDEIKN